MHRVLMRIALLLTLMGAACGTGFPEEPPCLRVQKFSMLFQPGRVACGSRQSGVIEVRIGGKDDEIDWT